MLKKTYIYGALEPTVNADVAAEQFRRAHVYYNKLVEIERRRRLITEGTRREFSPALAAAESKIENLDARLDAIYEAINTKRTGSKNADVSVEVAEISALKKERAPIFEARKEAFKEIKNEPLLKVRLREIDHAAHAALKAERHLSGLCHGTYITVEEDIVRAVKAKVRVKSGKRPPKWTELPRFQRGSSEGRIGVQIQSGMSAREALDEKHTFFQLRDIASDDTRRKPRTVARIRVGSNDDRTPVWCEFPIVYHRPLPDGTKIRRAYLVRYAIGITTRYELQLQIDIPGPVAKTGRRTCALSVDKDGGIVVSKDEIVLFNAPSDFASAIDKCASLRAIRDKQFDNAKLKLVAWLYEHRGQLPEWFIPEVSHVLQWKMPKRIVGLLGKWKDQRFDGDGKIFEEMGAWSEQDRHLYRWESHQRSRAENARKDGYRKLAAEVASRYDMIFIDDRDLREAAEAPDPEEGLPSEGKEARKEQRVASPSELRWAVKNAFENKGCAVHEVEHLGDAATLEARAREILKRGEEMHARGELKVLAKENKGTFNRFRKKRKPDAEAAAGSGEVLENSPKAASEIE